jgi:hypothetical protein
VIQTVELMFLIEGKGKGKRPTLQVLCAAALSRSRLSSGFPMSVSRLARIASGGS